MKRLNNCTTRRRVKCNSGGVMPSCNYNRANYVCDRACVGQPTTRMADVTITKIACPHSHESVILFVFLAFILFKLRPLFTLRVHVHLHRRRSQTVHACGAMRLVGIFPNTCPGGVIAAQARHNSNNVGVSLRARWDTTLIFTTIRAVCKWVLTNMSATWTFTGRVFHPAQRPPPVERAPA